MEQDSTPVYAGIDTHVGTYHLAVINACGRPWRISRLRQPGPATDALSPSWAAGTEWRRWGWSAPEATAPRSPGACWAPDTAWWKSAAPAASRRRARGKTDNFDAYSAAEAVLADRAVAAPRGADGLVEALRVLRTTRTSGLRERTATINQIKALLVAGHERVRAKYRGLFNKLLAALAASRPPAAPVTAEEATAYALRILAGRHQLLTSQI
ncbi:IS110 family transposase [Kocuria rhizosphaericola]|uniref:IS110 family transposase n=1 Tax=Kocuria rhizosphaericola TaxID=3376284 RepID=UPI00379624F8